MPIQLELWHLITLLLAFFGAIWAFGKVLLDQVEKRQTERFTGVEKRQTERFAAQEESRKEAQKHWDTKFAALDATSREESNQWQRIERELLLLKAELPVHYVRREDYIRNQTVIEAKIDGVALRIENLQLKGFAHDR